MRVCRDWEDGLLSEKSAGCNNVIGIAPPYGDGDHINRFTGVPMGAGVLLMIASRKEHCVNAGRG